MTEIDLDKLKKSPVPAPREDARKAALSAAMQAFVAANAAGAPAAAQSSNNEAASNAKAPPAEISAEPAKEPDTVVRLKRTSTETRRFTMFAPGRRAALAATLAVMGIGIGAVQLRGVLHNEPARMAKAPTTPRQQELAQLDKAKSGESSKGAASAQHAPAQPAIVAEGTVADQRHAEAEAKQRADARSRQSDDARRLAEARARAEVERRKAESDRQAQGQPQVALIAPATPPADGLAAGGSSARSSLGVRSSEAPPPATAPLARVAKVPAASAPNSQPARPAPIPGLVLDGVVARNKAKPAEASDSRVAILEKRELVPPPVIEPNRDRFATAEINPVKSVAAEPVSTFSIDVDTASYSIVRRTLNGGRLPPREAVRVEEMINYFPYAYPRPDTNETPFRPTVTVLPAPWNPTNKLVHIAIKGYDLKSAERPRANLVFLVDISGSMAPADRLPLLKNAFRMLLDNLKPDDTVAIVTYASGSDIRLAPTKVSERYKIVSAIESLNAGGSTHGAAGIADAYRVAEQGFDNAAVNRVILATDGDWNVGITDRSQLTKFIEAKRQTGIYLSILGVGMGNHNDQLMQALAQNGNGAAAYIDTLSEARKVLVDEASSTLFPIAKDVKIQIEFNPATVKEYRLIGYETRSLKREDFNNDKVDAGDIGSGHTVTAIYEVTPVGLPGVADDLRYRQPEAARREPAATSDGKGGELAFLKMRYKRPAEDTSRLIEIPVRDEDPRADRPISDRVVSPEVRFSVAVAAFGDLLRGAPYLKAFTFDDVISLANAARGDDPFGYRTEFVNLVRLAKSARPFDLIVPQGTRGAPTAPMNRPGMPPAPF